jgi:hypothetical protein
MLTNLSTQTCSSVSSNHPILGSDAQHSSKTIALPCRPAGAYKPHSCWVLQHAGGFNFNEWSDRFRKGAGSLWKTVAAVLMFGAALFVLTLWRPLLALLVKLVRRATLQGGTGTWHTAPCFVCFGSSLCIGGHPAGAHAEAREEGLLVLGAAALRAAYKKVSLGFARDWPEKSWTAQFFG